MSERASQFILLIETIAIAGLSFVMLILLSVIGVIFSVYLLAVGLGEALDWLVNGTVVRGALTRIPFALLFGATAIAGLAAMLRLLGLIRGFWKEGRASLVGAGRRFWSGVALAVPGLLLMGGLAFTIAGERFGTESILYAVQLSGGTLLVP